MLPLEPVTSSLPEYVITKSEVSYPPVDVRAEARLNSRGPDHASDRALERANDNSVLSGEASADGDVVVDERRNGTFRRRANSQGAAHANARALERANARSALRSTTVPTRADNRGLTRRTEARVNSRGRLNASDRARERANANSAIKEE